MSDIDTNVLQALYALRDPVVTQAFIWFTELGSAIFVGGVAACTMLLLLIRAKFSYCIGLGIAVGGAGATVYSLKEIVGRLRPAEMYQAYLETGFAFPSGHAALSLALYGFLSYLAWKYLPRGRAIAMIVLAALLSAAIGFSRLYLGVHYLSDVLAGFAFAAVFLSLGILTSERFGRSSILNGV